MGAEIRAEAARESRQEGRPWRASGFNPFEKIEIASLR
jgi:hypothetical protein